MEIRADRLPIAGVRTPGQPIGITNDRSAPPGSGATAGLIEGPGEDGRPTLGRRMLSDGLLGFALGVLSGLAVLALADLALNSAVRAVVFAVPVMLTVMLTSLGASVIAAWAERVADSGRRVSQNALTGIVILLAATLYLSLTAGAASIAASVFLGRLG
jgi:hypothetical protein